LAAAAPTTAGAAAAAATTTGDQYPAARVQTAGAVTAILAGVSGQSRTRVWSRRAVVPVIAPHRLTAASGAARARCHLGRSTYTFVAPFAASENSTPAPRAVHAISTGGAAPILAIRTVNAAIAVVATITPRVAVISGNVKGKHTPATGIPPCSKGASRAHFAHAGSRAGCATGMTLPGGAAARPRRRAHRRHVHHRPRRNAHIPSHVQRNRATPDAHQRLALGQLQVAHQVELGHAFGQH